MKRQPRAWVFLVMFVIAVSIRPLHAAETRIFIGVTETMDTFNPYADSVSLMYSVWCQVLGCLGTYDFDKGQPVGLLVDRWEIKDPKFFICVRTSSSTTVRRSQQRMSYIQSIESAPIP